MRHYLGTCSWLTGVLVVCASACSGKGPMGEAHDSGAGVDSAMDEVACLGPGPGDVVGEAGTAAGPMQILSYGVLDAEYSTSLDAIVMVTYLPDQALHIYAPATGVDMRVTLPWAPFAVSVSPDGMTAAVAHDVHLSYVDLVSGALIKSCDSPSAPIDIVLASNGWAYLFPERGQWCPFFGILASSCALFPTPFTPIYAGTVAKLHPSGTKMYGATVGIPDNIERYEIPAGVPAYGYVSPYWGDYPICNNLWMSADGLRIFTACGHAFHSSDVRSQDMTHDGSLEGVSSLRQLYHASAIGKVLSIGEPYPRYDRYANEMDTTVRVHDYQSLTLDATLPLPPFPGDCGATFVSHGRFVFANNAGTFFHVILQADSSSGLVNDHAIVTLAP